jgi:nitrous oxidase accessory protein NosD
MKNKMLALVATLMLLATVFVVRMPVVMANTILNVPGDYLTIQDAISAASSGDTIIVAVGTYAGAVVDKNVTIIGGSGGVSIITSGVLYKVGGTLYTAFRLDATADGAKIKDFTIDCNSSEGFYFAVFSRNADNVIVDSLVVNDAVQGITNWGGSNWEITNNVLNNTEAAGGGGIAIWLGATPPSYPVCSGNLIQNNTITASATAPDYTCPGIGVGLDLRYGAYDYLTGSEDISNNQILYNNITAPGALNGVGVEIGVLGLEGNATKIAATLGIVHDNIIQGNNVEGADLGVYLYTVTHLEIMENEIKNCNEGIHIKDGISDININYNNIFGNGVGINNTAGETIDARYNWWGSQFGPTASPPAGDKISGYVDYAPWLIEQYPPAVLVPKLYVDPETKEVWTPAECTEFNVTTVIEGVTDLYGFEFKLTWNSSLINLVRINVKVNQIWTNYFIAHNETWHGPDCTDWYWLAASATAPTTEGFDGTAILVELTFHIKYDPCYPDACSTPIHFVDVKLSDSYADPIPIWVQDGLYQIRSSKPKLEIKPASTTINKYQDFPVEIWLRNATKVYSYAFEVCYNTTILDVANVVIHPGFLPGPYLIKSLQINEINGSVYVELQEADNAPPANGDGLLVTITFRATEIAIWKKGQNNTLHSLIEFKSWKLDVKCPEPRILKDDLVGIENAEYWFTPVPGDVNSDGVVNVVDLRMVAMKWGSTAPEILKLVDLNCDSNVDIYDLVLVAKNLTP